MRETEYFLGRCCYRARAVDRGGHWNNGLNGGVLNLNTNTPSNTNSNIGFRCPPLCESPRVLMKGSWNKAYGGRTSVSTCPTDERAEAKKSFKYRETASNLFRAVKAESRSILSVSGW